MDWSFLAYETQLVAKYYRPAGMALHHTSGRCEILNSQGQVFLTFRYEINLTGTLEMVGKMVFCCCLTQSMPETVKKTASHPTFGDVITSRQIKNELCCAACSGDRIEGFYSGEQLLGAFQTLTPSGCNGPVYSILDANSNPFMSDTAGKITSRIRSTQVFRQGEEVACTIQGAPDHPGGMFSSYTGATATALFSAQLPIPIKLCLLMRTAEVAVEAYAETQKSRR